MRLKLLFPATLALPALCSSALLAVPLRYDSLQTARAAWPVVQAGDFSPEGPSALRCSDRNLAGVGLKGDYFLQAGMKGQPLLSRVDPTVEFDASLDWPADRRGSRPRSARWMGWVKAPMSGRYRFHGEPAATITVAGLPMAGRAAAADASIDMTAGRFYPILMEADLLGATQVRLEWTAPHGVRYVIPRALLFLPTATAS